MASDDGPPSVFEGEDGKELALLRIEEERRLSQDKWTVEKSGIAVSSALLYELELQNPDSFLHTFMKVMNVSNNNEEVRLMLEKCLSVLKRKGKGNDTTQLHRNSAKSATAGTYCVLRDLHARLYKTIVHIKRHKDFPTELFMVDLSFLPESFFFDSSATDTRDHSVLHRYYNACINKDNAIAPKMKTTHMRHCTASGKHPARQFHQDFCFNKSLEHTKYLKCIFTQLLQKYANMQENFSLEWAVSFLFTEMESQQDPHVDYRHKTLKTYRDRQQAGGNSPSPHKRKRGDDDLQPSLESSNNDTDEVDLPWSLDMPLMKGGMRLAFYGTESRQLLVTPEVIQVPFRNALFWRGDCVHAGCLADLLGGHGFRMHGYLPLKPQHRHMTYLTQPEIEWNDRSGKCRYSHRLRRFDGTEFPRGNEWV